MIKIQFSLAFMVFFTYAYFIITSLFVPHNFIHNLILHSIGILFFIFYKTENKIKYLKNIFLFLFFILCNINF